MRRRVSAADLARVNYHELARRAGLTPQHVLRVLRGTKGVSFLIAGRIADAANVSLDSLRAHIEQSPSFCVRSRRTRRELSDAA
jgi:transcriptional regulator with XRE-family HTH domain